MQNQQLKKNFALEPLIPGGKRLSEKEEESFPQIFTQIGIVYSGGKEIKKAERSKVPPPLCFN